MIFSHMLMDQMLIGQDISQADHLLNILEKWLEDSFKLQEI